MYEHVLVPTDGSEGASRAVEHAVAIADRFGATLHGVYVVETRTAYDNDIVDPGEVEATLRGEGEAALAALSERAAEAGVAVETDVRRGAPPEEIEAAARELDADLVVLGARGRSAFKERLLGSATERALRAGDLPVLVAERAN
jgi:nucleotide-binding universal stress UspA family protein